MRGTMPEQFLIALDIGTSKIGVAVVRRDLHGGFRYVAHGSAPSGGMQAGQFHDLDAVSTALRRGLAEAHSLAGATVNDVALTVGGIRIDALDLRGSTVFERPRDIQVEDVRRAIERAQHPDATGLHPIQRVVQMTLVDGEPVHEAVGRRGARLEVSVRDYAISTQTLEQIRTIAGQSGARIHTFIPAGVAAMTAVTTSMERASGVAVIDIGASSSDIAVRIGDTQVHVSTHAVGGRQITEDLAQVLDIPTEEAERLKRAHGVVGDAEDEPIDWSPRTIASLQRQARIGDIPPGAVRGIAQARVIQIIDALHADLRVAGVMDAIGAGVVITGGTAQLRGIDAMVNAIMRVPARVGSPIAGDGFPDVYDPSMSGTLGLARYCAMRAQAEVGAARRGNVAMGIVHPAFLGSNSGASWLRPASGQTGTLPVTSMRRANNQHGRTHHGQEAPATRSVGEQFRGWLREFIPSRDGDQM